MNELPKNLNNYYSKINLYSSIEKIETDNKFDFVIIDGADESIERIKNLVADNGVIFIEGDRRNQQNTLLNIFPKHKFVHTISNYKEPEYGPFTTGNWSGGGKLIYTNPTFLQKVNWLKEKFISAFRNRITRKFNK